MRRLRWLYGALLAGLIASGGVTQEPKADPVPGGFRMFLVADGRFDVKDDRNRIGKLHDPVTEYGLSTVVAAFVRGIPADESAPAVAVMKKQQQLAVKHEAKRLRAFTAYLALTKDFNSDDARDQRIAEIAKIAKAASVPLVSVGLAEATIASSNDAKDGAGQAPPQVTAWGIGANDALTIVVYHRLKIVKRWKFTADKPPTDADLMEVEAVVDEVMGKKKVEKK